MGRNPAKGKGIKIQANTTVRFRRTSATDAVVPSKAIVLVSSFTPTISERQQTGCWCGTVRWPRAKP